MIDRRLSVAPMMDCTDRFDRYLLRLITRRALLYTEMVTTGAVLHGDRARLLAYDPAEHPVALQLGGSDPTALAECARIAAALGYDEVNLNVGCPSDRVQSGRFGACLMAEPKLVAECVGAMVRAAGVPVTVKTRTGIDDNDSYDALRDFVRRVAGAGCAAVIVHARKAWLRGLSPKQNREVPPLDYDRVYELKRDLPDFDIVLNGGVATLEDAHGHLRRVDGVMIGRAAYRTPYMLARADQYFFGDRGPVSNRAAVAAAYTGYIERQLAQGVPLKRMTRHMVGLFQGQPGARAWRRQLAENAHRPGAGVEVVRDALDRVSAAARATERRRPEPIPAEGALAP
ncbi:MAG: tRNA dihydrouridine(20/20a) synthase DusA [Pseudomonadota bacterium]